jgi:Uma2 family endonuclease
MLSATDTKYYTPEEYLALEETSEDKNEYRQGEIIAIL